MTSSARLLLLFLLFPPLSQWSLPSSPAQAPGSPSQGTEGLPEKAREKLESLGFVVLGESDSSMEEFYTRDKYSPKFLTTDMFWDLAQRYVSLLFYWKARLQVELLRRFSRRILDLCRIRRSGAWKGILYFFAPALAFLEPGSLRRLPAKDREKVKEILARLEEGKPFHLPPFSGKVDPEDLKPHWTYARDPFLRRYFKAVVWYTILSLDLREGRGRRIALLLTREIFSDPRLKADYLALEGIYRDLLGVSMDLGPGLLAKRLEKACGKDWVKMDPAELWREGEAEIRKPLAVFKKMGWDFTPDSLLVLPAPFPPDTLQLNLDCEPFLSGRKFSSGLDLVAVGPVASEEGKAVFKREFAGKSWMEELFSRKPVPRLPDFYGLNLECLGKILDPCKEAPELFSTKTWREKEVWTQLGGLALLRRCNQPPPSKKKTITGVRRGRALSPRLAPYPDYYLGLCRCFSRMAGFMKRWKDLLPPARNPWKKKERKEIASGMEKAGRVFRSMENYMARLSVLARTEWSPLGPGPKGEAFLEEFPGKAYSLFKDALPVSMKHLWDGPMTFSYTAVFGKPDKGSFYFGVSRPHVLFVLLPRKGKAVLHKGLVLGYREGVGPYDVFDPPMEEAPLSYPGFTRDFRVEEGS